MYGENIFLLLAIKKMDKKFLHRVIDQIVSETRLDYDKERIYVPFSLSSSFSFLSFGPSFYFFQHCREVYGLNDDEIRYVLKKYMEIIDNKIKNREK